MWQTKGGHGENYHERFYLTLHIFSKVRWVCIAKIKNAQDFGLDDIKLTGTLSTKFSPTLICYNPHSFLGDPWSLKYDYNNNS